MSKQAATALAFFVIAVVLFKVYVIDEHPWVLWLLVAAAVIIVGVILLRLIKGDVTIGWSSVRDRIESMTSDTSDTKDATVAVEPIERKKVRTKPPKEIERAVFLRADNKCQFPECGVRENLEIHHIDGDHSNHALNNLIILCKMHHGKADHGQYKKVQLEEWSKKPAVSS